MASQSGVEVRAFLHLAGLVGEKGHVTVHPPRGATVASVARDAGLDPAWLGLVMVNGCKAELDSSVGEGDRVAFFPDYVPYHRVYGMCVL
ncbi:MAG: hypothetical protein KKA32_04510 [Actinobacteria bacterium]|nr:hypothetical protein [Actinomycetota bacterium]